MIHSPALLVQHVYVTDNHMLLLRYSSFGSYEGASGYSTHIWRALIVSTTLQNVLNTIITGQRAFVGVGDPFALKINHAKS